MTCPRPHSRSMGFSQGFPSPCQILSQLPPGPCLCLRACPRLTAHAFHPSLDPSNPSLIHTSLLLTQFSSQCALSHTSLGNFYSSFKTHPEV